MAVEAEARADLLHPAGLVGIIASSEIDQPDPVTVDHLFHQRSREHTACGELLRIHAVREFVNPGRAVLHGPELGRDGASVMPGERHAQPASAPFLFREATQQLWIPFLGFPASAVDFFVYIPCT